MLSYLHLYCIPIFTTEKSIYLSEYKNTYPALKTKNVETAVSSTDMLTHKQWNHDSQLLHWAHAMLMDSFIFSGFLWMQTYYAKYDLYCWKLHNCELYKNRKRNLLPAFCIILPKSCQLTFNFKKVIYIYIYIYLYI